MSLDYRVARLQAAQACVMPVRPGTQGDCTPCRPDDRTELCATPAWWLLGDLALCDQHLRRALHIAGADYAVMLARYRSRFPELVAGVPTEDELLPWSRRPRDPEHIRRNGLVNLHPRRWRRLPASQAAACSMRLRSGR